MIPSLCLCSGAEFQSHEWPSQPVQRRLACVVHLGNATERELYTFGLASKTWGAHCGWFVGLTQTQQQATFAKRFLNRTSYARIDAASKSAVTLPQVLQTSWELQGLFPRGPPDIICGFADGAFLFSPENFQRALVAVSLQNEEVFSIRCRSRMLCQTRMAGLIIAKLGPSVAAWAWQFSTLRLDELCGLRIEQVCNAPLSSAKGLLPVLVHAPSDTVLASLYASFYMGWPLPTSFGCDPKVPLVITGLKPPGHGQLPRVAVLIGSLVRSPQSSITLLGRLFTDLSLEYKVFIYTAPIAPSEACLQAFDVLRSDWVSATIRFSEPEDVVKEELFEQCVGSGHMRQWYKLRSAYSMMEDYERSSGHKFDLVFKMRTDIELVQPLDLSQFAAASRMRIVYSAGDMLFLCNREVASTLLHDILDKLQSRAGDQTRLLQLNYGRLLRSEAGNGLSLQVFPDTGDDELREALIHGKPTWKALVKRNLAALEIAHKRASKGRPVKTFTGHWSYRNDTPQFKYWARTNRLPSKKSMCSVRHWYYHVHRAEPEVLMSDWPQEGLKLSKSRHYHHCNCEPPSCIPQGWSEPRVQGQ